MTWLLYFPASTRIIHPASRHLSSDVHPLFCQPAFNPSKSDECGHCHMCQFSIMSGLNTSQHTAHTDVLSRGGWLTRTYEHQSLPLIGSQNYKRGAMIQYHRRRRRRRISSAVKIITIPSSSIDLSSTHPFDVGTILYTSLPIR
jgi:hypothetical protein